MMIITVMIILISICNYQYSSSFPCLAYPDPDQFDAKSKYYDAKSTKEKPRWFNIDIQLISTFPIITLQELKSDPRLQDLQLIKRGRLSVSRIKDNEAKVINDIVLRGS